MNAGIYKITNPKGKIYIGQTLDFKKRIKQYIKGHCEKQTILYNSIKKYGWQFHKVELILATKERLDEKEILLIIFFNSYVKDNINGMNISSGGSGNNGTGTKVYQYSLNGEYITSYSSSSEAERQNSNFLCSHISNCCKGIRKSHAGFIWKFFKQDKINVEFLKRTITEKEKLRLENCKTNPYWLGKKHTEESKRKVSKSRLAKPKEDLQYNKGIKKTAEARENMKKAAFKKSVIKLTMDFKYLEKFESVSDAAKSIEKGITSEISNVCKKPTTRSHKGFKWMYYEDWKQNKFGK